MRNRLTEEHIQIAKKVAEKYQMSLEMAYEYVDEWIIYCGLASQALRSKKVAYMYSNLNMTVPEAIEKLECLHVLYTIDVTKELPGTVWTCIYGHDLELSEARRAYKYFLKYGEADGYESMEYDQYLSLVEEGYSLEDALAAVYMYV